MAKMRAVQVARAGGALEVVERDVPEPKRGEVRVRVEACGVCHSDSFTGASIKSQDTLAFSSLSGVRPIIETMQLAQAAEAYDRMMRGDARFRRVLTMA